MTECQFSNIDELHMDAAIQYQVKESEYVSIKPVAPVKGASVVEFSVDNNGPALIDLYNSMLEVVFRVKKADGSDCDATDKVSVINAIGDTLWAMISLRLNGELVTERTPNQAFRAIVETLTGYGKDAVNSWLQSTLFYKDTAGKMDNGDPTVGDGNKGLAARYELTKNSKRVVTRSRIHTDMFCQRRYLMNFVQMRLSLQRNKDTYCLMCADNNAAYKIDIEDVTLRLKKVRLYDDVYNKIATAPAIYPFSRIRTLEYISPQGGKSWNIPNISNGVIPRSIIMGFVANEAVNGSYKRNPLRFHHYDLASLALIINGNTHNGSPLEFDFEDDQYLQGFWSLAEATGKAFKDDGLIINRADYKGGNTLYAFDLSPSNCDGQYKDAVESGDISIECKFKKAIPETLTLCVYMQFESSISINTAKQVTVNFQT